MATAQASFDHRDRHLIKTLKDAGCVYRPREDEHLPADSNDPERLYMSAAGILGPGSTARVKAGKLLHLYTAVAPQNHDSPTTVREIAQAIEDFSTQMHEIGFHSSDGPRWMDHSFEWSSNDRTIQYGEVFKPILEQIQRIYKDLLAGYAT